MKRRLLSIITTLALCLSLLPVSVLAAEDCDHANAAWDGENVMDSGHWIVCGGDCDFGSWRGHSDSDSNGECDGCDIPVRYDGEGGLYLCAHSAGEDNDHYCDFCGGIASECADAGHDHYCDTCGAVCWVDADADGRCDGDSCAAVLTHVQADYTTVAYYADGDGNTVADVTLSVIAAAEDKEITDIPTGTVTVVWHDEEEEYSADGNLTAGQAEVTYTGLPLDALEGGADLAYTPADSTKFTPAENGCRLDSDAVLLQVDADVDFTVNGVAEHALYLLPDTEVTVVLKTTAEGSYRWEYEEDSAQPALMKDGLITTFDMPNGAVDMYAEWICDLCVDEDEDSYCDVCGEVVYPDPDDLNMQTVPGDGQITVTWDALYDVGEDTVQSYTVYCYDDNGYSADAEYTGAGSHTFTGLTNDVEYSVGVDAEYGSEYSVGYEGYETPNGALKIKTAAEKGSLTVNWDKPESDDDAVIAGYEVTVARADDPSRRTTVEVEANAVSCTVDNLAGGTTYTVAVRVIYEDGDSIDSAPADVYVPFNVANIWIGGVRITSENADNVLSDGTVSYDVEKSILTLNGADITGSIYAVENLSIELVGANSVTASADADSPHGIDVRGNLSISGSGSLTAAGSAASTDAFSVGILVTGDLTLNSGSVTAFGGTSMGDTAFSGGVYTVGDLVLKDGSLTATGKEAEAGETGLGFSTGVYTTGDLALDGGRLTATGGSAKGYFAQSEGIFTEGDFTMYDGSLTATGGTAVSDAEGAYVTSIGIFTTGTYSMWDGSVTANGGNANGPEAYSAGVSAKGDLSLWDGSLTATGGTAEGDYAFSAGIEIASLDEEAYLNLAVYSGYLEANGGAAVGVTEAESAGVYAERSGLYIYGGEDGTPVVKLKGGSASVTSEKEADEPYASSNGVYVLAGDVGINAGDVTITGGSWVGTDGDGWAIYARADVEYDDGGKVSSISGGNVTIDCTEIALIPSPGHGFTGTRVILAGIDDDNGYAVYAGNSITIGDALAISDPEGGIIYTTDWGDMILESAEEGAPPAKSVTIGLLLHEVSFVIDGSSFSSAAAVPHGMSLNEAYASMIEEAGKTDFSELLNTAKAGYTFRGFYTDSGEKYDFDTAVSEDMTLTAKWIRNSSSTGGGGGTYTITVEDATNGTVKADRTRSSYGTTVKLTVTPDTGYTLETLTVTTGSGKEIELTNKGDGKYTFKMPSSKVTIKATFMDDNTMLNFFVDVPAGAYYYDAVLWAARSGITSGTTATTFSPDNPCTRAQMATFLWRAAGSPEPVGTSNPFVDIPADAYYAKAVQWAYEQGITGGTSATTFSPDATCTRGQMATFLWRNAGSQAVMNNINQFADVPASAYYTKAVQWAYEQKITSGTSTTTFSPDDPCTRAQMVTFLYRYFVK